MMAILLVRQDGAMRARVIALALLSIVMDGCSTGPVTATVVKRYTRLRLCPAAGVQDLTTTEERDMTPGFSFHVALRLPASCQEDFEAQLVSLAGPECPDWPHASRSCFIMDASRRGSTKKHATIVVTVIGEGRYDIRFYA
jgi:hypothetical protein